MRHTVILLTFCVFFLVSGLSTAIAEEGYDYTPYMHRWGVFGAVGTESGDPASMSLGGGFVFRAYPRAGFEFNIRHFQSQERNQVYEGYYSKLSNEGENVTASVHYYFSQERFQPYVLLGGGYKRIHSKSAYGSADTQEAYEHTENSLVLEAGSGVDIFLTHNLSVRPDARLLIGPDGNVEGSINLCYHW